MFISTIDHYYDFIEKEHGYEYVEVLKDLIDEIVSRETEKLKDNIDIYEEGFGQALTFLDIYEEKHGKLENPYDLILKTKRLSDKIYSSPINYYAEV